MHKRDGFDSAGCEKLTCIDDEAFDERRPMMIVRFIITVMRQTAIALFK
jgi:hypothetical protein